ncbi:MAG: dihydroorotate dehydrogenase electron transfer subunit [Elusimicrobiota bacterium]|jgi:dihydroorotate dehydrogenase electron transfer subunit|nr:dihydroorotate dehydrogenase electron transfer subunit [Elusimicrobiota bacterium]
MKNFKTEVLENIKLGRDIFRIKFKPQFAVARPGQFVEVLCAGAGAPFLRRPFCIHRFDGEKGICEILFRRVGRGTEILSNLKQGDMLDITGPLGKGFEPQAAQHHFIAGGGMGIAPLLFLAEELYGKCGSVKIFLAAKTAAEIPCQDIFKQFGEVILSTEDGTAGEKCLIDTPLERALKTAPAAPAIYACGPHGMLRCVAALGAKYKAHTQVSLEENMACGLGVCQGCAVEVKNKDTKYKMVCKEGPVFNAEDIVW